MPDGGAVAIDRFGNMTPTELAPRDGGVRDGGSDGGVFDASLPGFGYDAAVPLGARATERTVPVNTVPH